MLQTGYPAICPQDGQSFHTSPSQGLSLPNSTKGVQILQEKSYTQLYEWLQ